MAQDGLRMPRRLRRPRRPRIPKVSKVFALFLGGLGCLSDLGSFWAQTISPDVIGGPSSSSVSLELLRDE